MCVVVGLRVWAVLSVQFLNGNSYYRYYGCVNIENINPRTNYCSMHLCYVPDP
jgi:hypothetical protein